MAAKMAGTIRGLIASLALAGALAGASVASAIPAGTGPEELARYDFESTAAGHTFEHIEPMAPSLLGDPATTAYWGRTTGGSRSGAYGLWCAATNYPGGAPSSYWPGYVEGTRGKAWSSFPKMAEYYSVTVTMAYTMRSIGGADDYFRLGWILRDAHGNFVDSATNVDITKTDGWSSYSYSPSSYAGAARLTRSSADIFLYFNDYASKPATGTGPTVDDFTVLGYKYGPISSVTTAPAGGGSTLLTWPVPDYKAGSSIDDTRSIGYRVWRAPEGSDAWDELTSGGRVAVNSFTDNTAQAGVNYVYVVQAWDPGTGSGRGQASPLPAANVGVPVMPAVPVYRWRSFALMGTISPHTSASDVMIECSTDQYTIDYTYPGTVAAGTAMYSAVGVKLPAAGTWYVRVKHEDGTHAASYSAWTPVTVSEYIALAKPKSATKMKVNKTYTAYGTIKPVHSKTTYIKIRAYRLSGSTYKYVKSFSVKLTTKGQAADTAKYSASIKLTKKGKWKLMARHYAHGEEPKKDSSYSSRITVY